MWLLFLWACSAEPFEYGPDECKRNTECAKWDDFPYCSLRGVCSECQLDMDCERDEACMEDDDGFAFCVPREAE